MIVQDDGDRQKVFELGAGSGGRSLPVFSFEEEALLFLRLGGLEGRWRASETGAADLASALTRAVRRIVLDPFPEAGLRGYLGAVSLGREEFVDLFASGRRFRSRTASDPWMSEGRAPVSPEIPSEKTPSDR